MRTSVPPWAPMLRTDHERTLDVTRCMSGWAVTGTHGGDTRHLCYHRCYPVDRSGDRSIGGVQV